MSLRASIVRVVLGTLVAAGLTTFAPVPAAQAGAFHRILITGDSLTQGSAGDFTWRYRLWTKLTKTAPNQVSLVGTRTDLYDVVHQKQGSQSYAARFPATAHGALWGDSYAAELTKIGRTVTATNADVLVVMLGSNDLTYLTSPAATIAHVRTYLQRARAARPGLDVVVGEVPDKYDPWSRKYQLAAETQEYAVRLRSLAAALDTPGERVVVAPTRSGWDAAEDTWDGTHPNPTGEALIAQRVSEALARLGIGSTGPDVSGPTAWSVEGPGVSVAPGSEQAGLTWNRDATGATGMYIEQRLTNTHEPWRRLAYAVSGDHWTSKLLAAGGTYQFRVVPVKGSSVGVHGAATTSRTGGPEVGRVGVVKATAGDDSPWGGKAAAGSWTPATHATGYLISEGLLSNAGTRWHDLPYATTKRAWTFGMLQEGRRYNFRVRGTRGYLRGRWQGSAPTRMQGIPREFVQVALGDSYSSGLGSRKAMYSDKTCLRSAGSWVFQVEALRRRAIAHLACAGAREPGVRQQLPGMQRFFAAHRGMPQLITLTVGGNDVGFADELTNCVKADCVDSEANMEARIDAMARPLRRLYAAIRSAQPLADIVVGGYPELVDIASNSSNLACVRISGGEQRMISRLTIRLNDRIDRAARAAGVRSAAWLVRPKFYSHGACAGGSDAWINPFVIGYSDSAIPVSPLSFHPNDLGQQAYAWVFSRVWNGYTP